MIAYRMILVWVVKVKQKDKQEHRDVTTYIAKPVPPFPPPSLEFADAGWLGLPGLGSVTLVSLTVAMR